jgi:hypothetical protein
VFLTIYRHRSGLQVFKEGCQRNPPGRSPMRIQVAAPCDGQDSFLCSRLQPSSASDSEMLFHILESEALESWSRLQRRLSWPSHVAATWVRMDGSVGWVALAFLLARNSLSCSTPFIKKIQTKHFKFVFHQISKQLSFTLIITKN